MRKLVSVLVLALFFTNSSYSQSAEALTNSTIIKMVKAKLSDDLIIDEINGSGVNFNLSPESIKILSAENVSLRVLQAMRNANKSQSPSPEIKPETSPEPVISQKKDTIMPLASPENEVTLKEPAKPVENIQTADTLNTPVKEKSISLTAPIPELPKEKIKKEISINGPVEKSEITVEAIGYVIPLEELMTFYDKEFSTLSGTIKALDTRIRNFIEDGNQISDKISRIEKELTGKKNADSKAYSKEIIELKKQLAEKRESYRKFENDMVADGLKISKELEDAGNELDHSINNKYSDVSQAVKKSDLNPSVIGDPKPMSIKKQMINDNIVNHVLPVTEILFFFQNEIVSVRDIILAWNQKVVEVNQKDAVLSKQLEPLSKELMKYQSNPKENKKELAALKKQIAAIDKDKKTLARQMEADSKELADYLDQACEKIQNSVKERLSDIIANIKYSYQDNFTYRDI